MAVKTVTDTFDIRLAIKTLKRFTPVIVNDAADIVKKDITAGIEYGRDIKGKPLTPLLPATIKAKRSKGVEFPRRILWEKGIMQNSYVNQRATRRIPVAVLICPKSRTEIGGYHQKGEGNNPVREWFGISTTAHKRIDEHIRIKLIEILRSGWGLK